MLLSLQGPKAIARCANEWAALDDCSTPRPYGACLENKDNRKQAKQICGDVFQVDGKYS